jgi:selenocysteine-specific elongation factor
MADLKTKENDGDVLAYLEGAGEVVRTGSVIFAAEAYSELVDRIETHLREHETITLAQARDMFGTSRKYVQALLEHMDAQHITRRVGDLRVLR